MSSPPVPPLPSPRHILGFDPGRDKCGVAITRVQPDGDRQVMYHEIVASEQVEAQLPRLVQQYGVTQVVMGNQTTAKQWQQKLQHCFGHKTAIALVDERNSTAEAKERYWLMYPPQGLSKLIPTGLRTPPRPVDDIVAILLIERYLAAEKS